MDSSIAIKKNPKTPFEGFISNLIAGGSSGILSKTVAAPVERVKILLQTQKVNSSLTTPYKGPIDCISRVFRQEGILGFWRGNLANVYRYFPNQAVTFALKDVLKEFYVARFKNDKSKFGYVMNVSGNLAAAGVAGGVATFISYPFELARTRLAVDVSSQKGQHQLYRGTFDCLRKTYNAEGLRGVYAGFMVSITGVVLFRAGFIGGYDCVKYTYDLHDSGMASRWAAAQSVTIVVGTLLYPVDTVKRRLMVQQQGRRVYHSAWHCLTTILRYEGIAGLFHGLSMNLVRSFGGAVLLVAYDEIQRILPVI